MVFPSFKYATDTNPGSTAIYGAPDIVYAFHVIDGSHATDRIPIAAIEGTAVSLSANQTITGNKIFGNLNIQINNPLATFQYIINSGAITANRNAFLPLLTADDTFVFANFIQTLTNKSISGSQNTITSIDKSSITNTAVTLSDTQTLSGAKTFTAAQTVVNVVNSVTVLTPASSVAVDFNATDDVCTLANGATASLTITASNYAAGLTRTIIISNGSTAVTTLTLPAWVFVGGAAPTTIAANKTMVITVTSTGTTAGACVAATAVQS